jgi:hypothetical protein
MTAPTVDSPRILDHGWGHMHVDGLGDGKDFKLWPGGGREWDWRETGTHHSPGIQPGDVAELIDNGSRVIVLSRGRMLMLRTCVETLELLRDSGIEYFVEETGHAAAHYNELAAQGEPVGGLFHSTC